MGLTGKYDFPGIKKYGALGIETALGTTVWGAALLRIPVFGSLLKGALGLGVNWLANQGLMVLNIGAIIVEGHFDQKDFDSAMDAALKSVESSNGKLTAAQKKVIDDEVIKAFRKFAIITKHN